MNRADGPESDQLGINHHRQGGERKGTEHGRSLSTVSDKLQRDKRRTSIQERTSLKQFHLTALIIGHRGE